MSKFVSALALLALVFGTFAVSGTAQSAPMIWKVAIGGETPDHGIQAQIFAPSTIIIHAGDTVTWTMAALFDHTVSFLSGAKPPDPVVPQPGGKFLFNPQVVFPQGGKTYAGTGMASSGFLHGKDKNYSLTFTKAGRYPYLCILHPGMTGMVVVLPSTKKVPKMQAEYDRVASTEVQGALARGKSLIAETKGSVSQGTTGVTYTVPLIGAKTAQASAIRFIHEGLTINAGDTVRWVMKDPIELHTVTFSGTEQPPAFVNEEPQPAGPPKVYFNPKVVVPLGGKNHHGDGYYNSGFMMLNNPAATAAYSLTFTRPGTYTYWCVVHIPQGMKGTITVK